MKKQNNQLQVGVYYLARLNLLIDVRCFLIYYGQFQLIVTVIYCRK